MLTSYTVATIGLDQDNKWTVTYYGTVPEQGGLREGKGQLTFSSPEDALEFMRREVLANIATYQELVAQKEKGPSRS